MAFYWCKHVIDHEEVDVNELQILEVLGVNLAAYMELHKEVKQWHYNGEVDEKPKTTVNGIDILFACENDCPKIRECWSFIIKNSKHQRRLDADGVGDESACDHYILNDIDVCLHMENDCRSVITNNKIGLIRLLRENGIELTGYNDIM